MFAYSERPGTPAAKKLVDDIPESVKMARLNDIINLQSQHSHARNLKTIGQIHKVLAEGDSKKSENFLRGRNSANTMVIFPKGNHQKGDYVNVLINDCTNATLFGEVVE